jgi:hypothetical protein
VNPVDSAARASPISPTEWGSGAQRVPRLQCLYDVVVPVHSALGKLPAHACDCAAELDLQRKSRQRITLGGASAGVPPPGLYMIDQAFTYQSNLAVPGNSVINPHGTTTGVPAAVAATAFVWVPGWTFLGATYDAAWRYRWACLLPAVR